MELRLRKHLIVLFSIDFRTIIRLIMVTLIKYQIPLRMLMIQIVICHQCADNNT